LGCGSAPHLPTDAKTKRLPELLFEWRDRTADCRMRDMQLQTGCRERSGFGDRLDDFELAKIHVTRRGRAPSARKSRNREKAKFYWFSCFRAFVGYSGTSDGRFLKLTPWASAPSQVTRIAPKNTTVT